MEGSNLEASRKAVELADYYLGGTANIRPENFEQITEIQAGGAILSDATNRKRHVETDPAIFLRATITR